MFTSIPACLIPKVFDTRQPSETNWKAKLVWMWVDEIIVLPICTTPSLQFWYEFCFALLLMFCPWSKSSSSSVVFKDIVWSLQVRSEKELRTDMGITEAQ